MEVFDGFISSIYRKKLLKCAAEMRPPVIKYLQQEIDFDEPFAFVEYWARGYTQDCLSRLLKVAAGKELGTSFYYARSIYWSEGKNIRYNFTTNNASLIFLEAIFANMPYKSISVYEEVDGRMEPVLIPWENDEKLHEALEIYLTSFAKEFYSNKLIDEEEFEQKIFNFAMNYYHDYEGADLLTKNIAHLKYTEVQYDKVEEFAPEITFKKIMNRALKKEYFKTKSKKMSLARSRKIYRNIYMV